MPTDLLRSACGPADRAARLSRSGAVATPAEIDRARRWVRDRIHGAPGAAPDAAGSELPFSFVYGDRPAAGLVAGWERSVETAALSRGRVQHTVCYRDPRTGLAVRWVVTEWLDFPTVEWTVHLRNDGDADTPVVEALRALDTEFRRGDSGEFCLHHHAGDDCTINSFAPRQTELGPGAGLAFAAARGRPTSEAWPYYNLELPDERRGVIVAIGWPGQWACRFDRDAGTGLRVAAGQEVTRFRLHPREQVRSPLVVLQFYEGDRLRAQNLWRRWMLEENLPPDHGEALAPRLGAASVQYCQFNSTQAQDLEFVRAFVEKGIPLDYWWMDAGWYVHDGAGWPKVGTWEVDRVRFPGGLRAVSEACHRHGVQLLVWFEVERVHADTWLAQQHPEWIHGGAAGGLFRMDEPAAVRWLTDHVDRMITDEGIDLYRSDFNIDPLDYWRRNDGPERQGITEIRYIEGYLAFWDELRRRHPGMLIDSCASGGRRNDLETMRRAVPLLRSDFEANPEGNQCHTYGFAQWLPYYNAVHNWDPSLYRFRSSMAPFVQRNWDVRRADFDAAQGNRMLAEWRRVADCYLGDFYPLGDYSTQESVWMAWQFDRPDLGVGVVQVFARGRSPYVSAAYRLHALAPDASYVLTELGTERTWEATGRQLREDGLSVTIDERPGAVVIRYGRASG